MTIDSSTFDIETIRPRLRRDLRLRLREFGRTNCCVIEDPATSRFYRIGTREYAVLSMFDGETTIGEAVAGTSESLGADALSLVEAAALTRWALTSGLASTAQSRQSERVLLAAEAVAKRKRAEWLNPICLKIPFGNPDPILKKLAPLLGWVFSPLALLVWLGVVATGLGMLAMRWGEFSTATFNTLSPDNWIWLACSWLVLKLVHEAAHGLACRRFGGETREAGVLLLLFIPLPWVDVTSSWRFASRWRRIAVASAGMYAELFLAGIAAVVWARTSAGLLHDHAFNVVITAGFVTLLFNANPLMRFDGYYILTDLLQMPNLATHGRQDLSHFARRWLFGVVTPKPEWPEGRGWLVRTYGIAALIWRILVCATLIIAAERLFYGAGIVLAVVAVVAWVVMPMLRLLRYFVKGDPVNPPRRLRFVAITGVLFCGGFFIWNHVPYVERITVPAIVDYPRLVQVRSKSPGFVEEIHVRPGQKVRAGDTLMVLKNRELELEIVDHRLAIAESRLRATRYHTKGNLAAAQMERETEASLRQRLQQLQEQSAALVLQAPSEGVVVSQGISETQGRWIKPGTPVIMLGNSTARRIHALIPQEDVAILTQNRQARLTVRLWGNRENAMSGSWAAETPRAGKTPRHPSLAASNGGPIPVQPTVDGKWGFLTPHIEAEVELSDRTARHLGAGRTGEIEMKVERGTVGDAITRSARRWFDSRR